MKTHDLVELAARNLRESVLRNALTTLGIAVGIASLVAMLSLGIGLQEMATNKLTKSGLFDTIVVTSRRDFRSFNSSEQKEGPAPAESRALDENARTTFAQLPNVLEATPDIRFITEVRYENKPHLTMVACLPSSAARKDAFDNMQGTFFTSEYAAEAILQKDFAEELLGITPGSRPVEQILGKELILRYAERVPGPPSGGAAEAGGSSGEIETPPRAEGTGPASFSVVSRERTLRIVGVTDQDPETLRGSSRGRVYIPLKLGEAMHIMLPSELRENTRSFSAAPTYLTVSVRVVNPKYVQPVQFAIRRMGFNTFSILDATRSLRRFFSVLDVFLGIFGSLALAVASIGIINTLVMAILERRREIGIMKAIGASDADVKQLFFAEAGAMGLIGGALGVILGWAIGKIINFGTNIYLQRQDLPPENIWLVPLWLVGAAMVFAVIVSLLAGLYPASRAAKLDPVRTLRYE